MNTKFAAILVVVIIALGAAIVLVKHSKTAAKPPAESYSVRYLPLGDSYTIGQSVSESQRWPNQLVAKLRAQGISIGILANPSVTGYTTLDLINTELPLVDKLKPNFVTIQIGVNDYVQGVSADVFTKNLDYIMNYVQQRLPNKTHILLVTIPDYGKTPTGAEYGAPATSEAGVKAFNAIIESTAKQYGVRVADVFPASEKVISDPSLIASDGLHPSGKQYALWVDAIYPQAKAILKP